MVVVQVSSDQQQQKNSNITQTNYTTKNFRPNLFGSKKIPTQIFGVKKNSDPIFLGSKNFLTQIFLVKKKCQPKLPGSIYMSAYDE